MSFMGHIRGVIEDNEDGLPDYMRFDETGIIIIPPSSPWYPE